MSIPKIVHYVWVGPRAFPAEAHAFVAGWRALLPDYEFILWDERNIDFDHRFIRQAQGVRAYNRVANYARLLALEKHGGFYLDHDVELIKSLDSLTVHRGVLGFQTMKREADLVNNAVIGAEPGHPFIKRALGALDGMDGSFDWKSGTGPGLLTRLLVESDDIVPRAEPYSASEMTLFPPEYFYPFEWTDTFDPSCIMPDTIAVHHWDHSWGSAPGWRRRILQKALATLTWWSPWLASNAVGTFDKWTKKAAERRAARNDATSRSPAGSHADPSS